MAKNTIPVELDKVSVKMLLSVLDKYVEKHHFGSPIENQSYNETYTKLKIALFELSFMDGNDM